MPELTKDDLQLLLHFAILGQNEVIVRNNHGDREVAKTLEPVISKVFQILSARNWNT